ncbi:hypothetical protein DS909_00090 [Phaeobacter gallaeciensis]|uniref:Uncharacterized protein n=1 Tax=Phaeobacter gallaeciensis TaxID=60890 RepID=A0A366XGE0_9RHOB|nr:hypothetical protein DS909_00090 [Phaeobacter gallaeciensis]
MTALNDRFWEISLRCHNFLRDLVDARPRSFLHQNQATFVRIAALWPAKILRNVSDGCFGEAAMQHLYIGPRSGLGRKRLLDC